MRNSLQAVVRVCESPRICNDVPEFVKLHMILMFIMQSIQEQEGCHISLDQSHQSSQTHQISTIHSLQSLNSCHLSSMVSHTSSTKFTNSSRPQTNYDFPDKYS